MACLNSLIIMIDDDNDDNDDEGDVCDDSDGDEFIDFFHRR